MPSSTTIPSSRGLIQRTADRRQLTVVVRSPKAVLVVTTATRVAPLTAARITLAAHELFESVERRMPIRLIGVRAEKLRPAGSAPLALWDDDQDWRRIEDALDGAVAKFGRGAVTRATLLGKARGGGSLPSSPPAPKPDQG